MRQLQEEDVEVQVVVLSVNPGGLVVTCESPFGPVKGFVPKSHAWPVSAGGWSSGCCGLASLPWFNSQRYLRAIAFMCGSPRVLCTE